MAPSAAARRSRSPEFAVQLALWYAEPATPAPPTGDAEAVLATRLAELGLPASSRVVTHRNEQVMLSWSASRGLRLHEGYAGAPDEVLRAIVTFLTPGTRRSDRLAARRAFLAFPADEHAPTSRPRSGPRPRPTDGPALARLRRLHCELNHQHFDGALQEIPILLSGRMRRRLGELRLERKSGRAMRIVLSRRHLRRDGWDAAAETLLHEMVHQWQAESGHAVDHGRDFRRKAREVGIPARATRVDL